MNFCSDLIQLSSNALINMLLFCFDIDLLVFKTFELRVHK